MLGRIKVFWLLVSLGLFVLVTSSFANTMDRVVFDPHGKILLEQEITLAMGNTPQPLITQLPVQFSEFVNNAILSNELASAPFCKMGGEYIAKESYRTTFSGGEGHFRFFSCRTTLDLFNSMRVPASWSGNRLLITCNDARDIYDYRLNYDLFTPRFSSYKACVVRNLDLASDSVVIGMIDVGNSLVDSSEQLYTKLDTPTRGLSAFSIDAVTFSPGVARVVLPSGAREIEFSVDEQLQLVQLFESGSRPTTALKDVAGSPNFGYTKSRMLMVSTAKNRVGYEVPVFVLTQNQDDNERAMFVVSGIPEQICLDGLGYYGATSITGEAQAVNHDVSCFDNRVYINSDGLGSRTAYALFVSLMTE